jgi:hypothetical protein
MAGERRQAKGTCKAREVATAEFVTLREPGQLTSGRVRTVAEELGVGTRTVWQWAVGLVKDCLSR